MAGTKRPSPAGNGKPPKKSARSSKPPSRLGFEAATTSSSSSTVPVREIHRPGLLSVEPLELQATNDALTHYNYVLNFIPASQLARSADHAALLRDRDDIASLYRETEAYIHKLRADIRPASMEMLRGAAAKDPSYWYQNGDLMSLDLNTLFEIFEEFPVQDAVHFRTYISKIIPPSLRKAIEGSPSDSLRVREEQMAKVFQLRSVLCDSPDPREFAQVVHFSVFMITSILPRGCWELMWNYSSRRDYLRWSVDLHEDCRNLFVFLDSVLTPPESKLDAWWETPSKNFFDAPALCRELLSVYTSHTCGPPSAREFGFGPRYDQYYLSDHGKRWCFHGYTVRLLRALLRHAHKQMRERTLRATGSRLPTELTDLIFEYALQSEGIPTDHDDILLEPITLAEEEIFDGSAKRLRAPYVCRRMLFLPEDPDQRSCGTLLIDGDIDEAAWLAGAESRIAARSANLHIADANLLTVA